MTRYLFPALLVAACLGAFCAGRSMRAPASEVRWTDAVDRALGPMAVQYETTVRALSDSLTAVNAKAAKLSQRAALFKVEADSLRNVRHATPLPPVVPASCAPWADQLTNCEREVAVRNREIASLAADTATLRHLASFHAKRDTASAERADTLARLLTSRPGARLTLRPFVGANAGLAGDVEPEVGVRLRRGEGQAVRAYARLQDGEVELRVGGTVEF